MPVRSLTSSTLKWPDRQAVDEAVRGLAQKLARSHPELERLGYFGSYARGDWGVGSDIDLIALVTRSGRSFTERRLDFDLGRLPVPADLLVYTLEEWEGHLASGDPFFRRLAREVVWIPLHEGGGTRDAARATPSPQTKGEDPWLA